MNRTHLSRTFWGGQRLEVAQGDITTEQVDAIVNAANKNLQHGGGVAWAIARAGGPIIQQESDAWVRTHGPISHDQPAITRPGNLPCRYVIHAAGPIWGEGDEDAKLSAAVTSSLQAAERLGLQSVALPAISTGIYGFPKTRAAQVILSAIAGYFNGNPNSGVALVRVVLYDTPTFEAFRAAWEQM